MKHIKRLKENNLPEGDKVFEVSSGLDAFVFHTKGGDVYRAKPFSYHPTH